MLGYQKYLVKERVAFLKLTDVYDIFDAETGEQVGIARENPGQLITLLRLLINKRLLPTKVEIRADEDGDPIMTIQRPVPVFSTKVHVLGEDGNSFGYFKSKFFSLGGAFKVFNRSDEHVATIKGDWKGWNFKFLTIDEEEIGLVTKKWAGIGKELLTSADNYVISLNGEPSRAKAALLLAAGLAIDMIYKER